MFFSFKEMVCAEKEGVLKRIWPKKDKIWRKKMNVRLYKFLKYGILETN